jgi:hypothetical protein
LWVEPLRAARQRYEAAFDEISTFVTAGSSPAADRSWARRIVPTRPCWLPDARTASLRGGKRSTGATARVVVGRHNDGDARTIICSIRLDHNGGDGLRGRVGHRNHRNRRAVYLNSGWRGL